MTDKTALKELDDIIKMEGNRIENGYIKRKIALEAWIEKWVVELTSSQSIINKKLMNLDFEENMKELLSFYLIEDMAEKCISFNSDEKQFKASLIAFKKRLKK